MKRKATKSLPGALRYLLPLVEALRKSPPEPEEYDNDAMAAKLDRSLKKRLKGLDEDAAAKELSKDRRLLEQWLKTSPPQNRIWHYTLGLLAYPDLAELVLRPLKPLPRGPKMRFALPPGWKKKVVLFRLDLKKGKLIGTIQAIDESSFENLLSQQNSWTAPPPLKLTRDQQNVSFGDVSGKKYIFRDVTGKRVDYVLRVPGGFVHAFLGTLEPAEFDEEPFEAKLNTLRLSE